jgi:hypothetical protein
MKFVRLVVLLVTIALVMIGCSEAAFAASNGTTPVQIEATSSPESMAVPLTNPQSVVHPLISTQTTDMGRYKAPEHRCKIRWDYIPYGKDPVYTYCLFTQVLVPQPKWLGLDRNI